MGNCERNVEIKAKFHSEKEFKNAVYIAENLTNNKGEVINQHDVFFNSNQGRLKIRYTNDENNGQIIQYNRPDQDGPKLSEFNRCNVQDIKQLEIILKNSIGIKGIVDKVRKLFIYNNVRIHLDNVAKLGYFLEFEVMLGPTQTIQDGELIANNLIKKFDIKKENLMSGAYLDELIK